jgi:hypothetical protein
MQLPRFASSIHFIFDACLSAHFQWIPFFFLIEHPVHHRHHVEQFLSLTVFPFIHLNIL